MLDLSNIEALRALRAQFEESTPAEEWPGAAASEMMLLADICCVLELGETETRQVLGDAAFCFVAELTGGQ